jgi:hypothetical protein
MAEREDEIDRDKPRRSYLVTYTRANLEKFPSRESFADTVFEAFDSKRSSSKPQYGHAAERNMQTMDTIIIWL